MEAFAISRFNKISIKKMKKLVGFIDKMSYIDALDYLFFLPQKGAVILRNVLKSAGSNLMGKGFVMRKERVLIKSVIISRGSYHKRIKARARGHADRIYKPTVHVKVVVLVSG